MSRLRTVSQNAVVRNFHARSSPSVLSAPMKHGKTVGLTTFSQNRHTLVTISVATVSASALESRPIRFARMGLDPKPSMSWSKWSAPMPTVARATLRASDSLPSDSTFSSMTLSPSASMAWWAPPAPSRLGAGERVIGVERQFAGFELFQFFIGAGGRWCLAH